MPLIYDQAVPFIHEMANKIMSDHHPELQMPDGSYPTLCIMFVKQKDPDEDEPPLKINGDPKAAIISVVAYKQRADERRDAEILIDEVIWGKLNDRQKVALLDHELTHLELQIDEDGILKTDDCGRPKLRMRLHDWTLTGFRSIAKRYGDDALEVIEARRFMKDYGSDVLAPEELFAH